MCASFLSLSLSIGAISCSPINWRAQRPQQFPTNRHCHFPAHPPPAVAQRRRAPARGRARVQVRARVSTVQVEIFQLTNSMFLSSILRHWYHQARRLTSFSKATDDHRHTQPVLHCAEEAAAAEGNAHWPNNAHWSDREQQQHSSPQRRRLLWTAQIALQSQRRFVHLEIQQHQQQQQRSGHQEEQLHRQQQLQIHLECHIQRWLQGHTQQVERHLQLELVAGDGFECRLHCHLGAHHLIRRLRWPGLVQVISLH